MLVAASTRQENFVDIDVSPLAWVALGAIILLLLAIDLYRHREAHEPSAREALVESGAWVASGLLFGVVVAVSWGGEAFGEYISGYLIEKSLSVDNVFVWAMIFSTMAIPVKYQHRVLFWGIFGALALRGIFIAVGSALISSFIWVLVFFGLFLIYTGLRVIRHRDDEGEQAARGTGLVRRFFPTTDEFDGQKFFTKQGMKRVATPLFSALVVVELTDVIFAVDSVPAILAVSNEPYLVFASNAFAILGLRAMYFLLANARQRFHYLSHALGGILIFVGIKMVLANWYHVDTYVSLAVIGVILVAAVVLSERKTRRLMSDTAT
ncbi:MAG: TerC family protein [Acidimicrobiia bacterium]|nr:TerC family protein [Acidimicrobiia bacterium]